MSRYSSNELDEHEERVRDQAGLRPANAPACPLFHAIDLLQVGFLQLLGRGVDAGSIGFGVFTRLASRYDEFRIFGRIRSRHVNKEVSPSHNHRRLEAIDSGQQVVELGARLAPGEEQAFLSKPAGELDGRGVTLLAPVRVECFLLLLEGFLCHPLLHSIGLQVCSASLVIAA